MTMQFNNRFFDELGRSPGVTQAVTKAAVEIARTAIKDAPRDTNDYADSIHVRVKQQRRSVALVVAADPKAMLVEAKTGNLVRALNKHKRGGRG